MQVKLLQGAACGTGGTPPAGADVLIHYQSQSGPPPTLSCGTGLSVCSPTSCLDLADDNANCGACGVTCGPGSTCANGTCTGPAKSPNGAVCTQGTSCQSNICAQGVCCATTCTGPCQTCAGVTGACSLLPVGSQGQCASGSACTSNGTCQAVQLGLGLACTANSQCSSNACDGLSLTCVGSQCADHRQDGAETDVDCGGPVCSARCAAGLKCQVNSDCATQACDAVTHMCDASQCMDNQKDGVETDVDCGGGTCATCATGKNCLVNTDCTSNACNVVTNTCVASTCQDNQKDGNETDVDCGGANACARCAVGQKCNASSDCQAGHVCSAGTFTCQ